jgi:hypothetical protein
MQTRYPKQSKAKMLLYRYLVLLGMLLAPPSQMPIT